MQVRSLLPQHYTTSGSPIVEFIETYYRWLETILVRPKARDRDVDTVDDDVLAHLAATYFAGIDLSGVPDKRLLIKHAADLYTTKGTPRGIKLLMRILLQAETDVYYPGNNVLRPSDNTWYAPNTIEATVAPGNKTAVGREITGLRSGAVAFVDDVVTLTVAGVTFDVLTVVAVNGAFSVGEPLSTGGIVRGSAGRVDVLTAGVATTKGFVAIVGGGVSGRAYVGVDRNGFVNNITVTSSGFKYTDQQTVDLVRDGVVVATGEVRLTGVGVVEGKWLNDSGSLSGANALFDGDYFQDYSYEVRAPASLDKYINTLTTVSHVAGTKAFGKPVLIGTTGTVLGAEASVTTISL